MKAVRIIVLILTIVSVRASFAQVDVDDKADWKERIYFGGGGGFNGGTSNGIRYWSISVTPVVGYMVTSNFSVGTAVAYQRTSFQDFDFNYSQYGVMPFVRYNFNDFFLTAEYNYINLPRVSYSGNGYSTGDRFFADRMLFGAGYSQPLGGRGRLNAMGLYDVLWQQGGGFQSPWVFRVFFSF
jgi:hypothetical protein